MVVLAQQLQVVSKLVGLSQFLCFESVVAFDFVLQVGPLLQIAELQELVLPSVCCLVLL